MNTTWYDDPAERAILGAALSNPKITQAVKLLGVDFGQPRHGELWDAIREVHIIGDQPDMATIPPRIPAGPRRAAVMELMTAVVGEGFAMNAAAYATTIRDMAERRRLGGAITGLQQRLNNLDMPIADIVATAERDLITTGPLERAADHILTLDEFCDQPITSQDWVIDGLLARGERVVLTGVEGGGKSVLLRMLAVTVAAGVAPFSLCNTTPRRLLYVDCENPVRIMVHKLDDIRQVMNRRRKPTEARMMIRRFPQGLDLAQANDRLELHHMCSVVRPDLLVIGPAYKLYVGGAGAREEDLARQVTSVLDGLREEFGFALILEHHSPHASPGGESRSVRPIGSSLWMRWPEFGFGLRPESGTKLEDRQVEVKHWRGAREERPWPKRLIGGNPTELPWIDPASLT